MDKKTFLERITEIGSCEDEVKRRSLLTEVSEEVSKVYDNSELLNTTINTLNTTIEKNNEEIERVQSANMELWLKVNAQKSEAQISEDITGVKKEPEKTYKSYDEIAEGFLKK